MRAAVLVLALLVPATAVAAGPPSATTGAASSVTQSGATVAGTVDPQGMATTYRFEYGTSTSYGLQTAEVDAGSGTGAVDASATLTGLTNDTTYHYRVVATNAAGVTRGVGPHAEDRRPSRAAGRDDRLGAQRHRRSAARLVGLGRPQRPRHDLPLRVRHDHQLRQAHRATRAPAAGRAHAASARRISGLSPNTRYHFRVVAGNDAGVARGRDRSFVTLRNPRGITASASPNPAVWSGSTTVSGKISGQGVGGATVALERQDFPFAGPVLPGGDDEGGRQRLVLLQGRPAVGDGPPAA